MSTSEALIASLPFTIADYTFEKVLGSGGFSTVFQVTHNSSGQSFAAKACKLCAQDKTKREIALKEMHFLRSLYHPNIIKIYDILEGYDHVFMILEFLSGGSSKKLVVHNHGMIYKNLISSMKQVLSAVAFCHSHNIAHRDIKPDNILYDASGRLVLSDFGLSCNISHDALISDFPGSLPFKAPEILKHIEYDPFKADMWSLGVTFYYWASGKMPWSNEGDVKSKIIHSFFRIPNNMPPAVKSIVQSLMVADPAKRPTAEELLQLPLFQNTKTEKIVNIHSKVPLAVRSQVKDILFQKSRRKMTTKSFSANSLTYYLSNQVNSEVSHVDNNTKCDTSTNLPPLKSERTHSMVPPEIRNLQVSQFTLEEDDEGPFVSLY